MSAMRLFRQKSLREAKSQEWAIRKFLPFPKELLQAFYLSILFRIAFH